MIHLVFGTSATGGLKLAFRRKGHQVIGFPIDFSVGPITEVHKTEGINNYFSWLKSSFSSEISYIEDEQKKYQQALEKLFEIDYGKKVTIWTCENATEQIALRISCYLLKEKQVELSLVNSFKAMHEYTKGKDYGVDIRHTGECNMEMLKLFYKNSIRPIPEEMRRQFEQDGEELLNSRSLFRTWRQGKIVHEPENVEDSFILKCAGRIHKKQNHHGYIDAMRLVGEVLGESKHTLSDAWIEYRVRSLIHSGQLAHEGDMKSIRTYKIKVIEC